MTWNIQITENNTDLPTKKFYNHMFELLNKDREDNPMDIREFEYYFNCLMNEDDDNINDNLREIFIILKLLHSENCPDYKKLDDERAEAEQAEEKRKERLFSILADKLAHLNQEIIDKAFDYVDNFINTYEFISKNGNIYRKDTIPNRYKDYINDLIGFGYIKESFWHKLLTTIDVRGGDVFSLPFDKINWYSAIDNSNAITDYNKTKHSLPSITNFPAGYNFKNHVQDKINDKVRTNRIT